MNFQKSKIILKTSIDDGIQSQELLGQVQKSGKLIRILYDEIYEGQNISTVISILSDNSLRIVKSGAYSYSLSLKENSTTIFNLNYNGYSVPYKCQTRSLKVDVSSLSVSIKAEYTLDCFNEFTNTTFDLKCTFEGELC